MNPMSTINQIPMEALIVILGVIAIYFVLGIVCYVLQAIGLYKMAKRRGIYHAWLAWLPLGNQWVLGAISDQFQLLWKGKKKGKRHLLPWLQILIAGMVAASTLLSIYGILPPGTEIILSLLLGLTVGVNILYMIFHALALFDYFHSARPGSAVCFLVVGLLVPCCRAFFVFADRNQDQSMPSARKDA